MGATYHSAYGVAIYVKNTVEKIRFISSTAQHNVRVHSITTKTGETELQMWRHVRAVRLHPTVYLGDFNNHDWKYTTNDERGETLLKWTESNHAYKVFDAQDRGTFKSATCRQEYNSDLFCKQKKAIWKFNRANWTAFTKDRDKLLLWIGYRKRYISGSIAESNNFQQKYFETGENAIAVELLSLDRPQRKKLKP